jgi:hypothetical protein
MLGHVIRGKKRSSQWRQGYERLGQVSSCYDMLSNFISGYGLLGQVGHVSAGLVMSVVFRSV